MDLCLAQRKCKLMHQIQLVGTPGISQPAPPLGRNFHHTPKPGQGLDSGTLCNISPKKTQSPCIRAKQTQKTNLSASCLPLALGQILPLSARLEVPRRSIPPPPAIHTPFNRLLLSRKMGVGYEGFWRIKKSSGAPGRKVMAGEIEVRGHKRLTPDISGPSSVP